MHNDVIQMEKIIEINGTKMQNVHRKSNFV
jgi:hypothetical protein